MFSFLFNIKIISFLLIICHTILGGIAKGAQPDQTNEPVNVLIGAYINGIHSIDLKEGTVDIDIYLWVRSKKTRNVIDSIEVMNGIMGEKAAVENKKIGDENYSIFRVTVKTYQEYDLSRFPLAGW